MERAITAFVALGLLGVPLSCGGRSLRNEDSGDAGSGDDGGSAGARGGSATNGGTTSTGGNPATGGTPASGGNAGRASGGAGTGARAGTGSGTDGCGASETGPWSGDGGAGFILMPSCNGWIDSENPVGIQGGWYPFGDQYPGPNDSRCLTVGMHTPGECSMVFSPPPPPALGFPQTVRGEMCTSGEVAMILPCPPALMTSGCPQYDYSNMSGAGIAFDFNADGSDSGGARHPWNPAPYGIVGFSFEIDEVPLPTMRVEIPMVLTDAESAAVSLRAGATTDQHPDGSPYWGASSTYPASPVAPGVNRVLWADIHPPRTNYVFDPTRMLGIEFHVPASTSSRGAYSFCIKNLTLLRP